MVFPVVASYLAGLSTACFIRLSRDLGYTDIRADHVTRSFLVSGKLLGTIRLCFSIFQFWFIFSEASRDAHHHVCSRTGEECVAFTGVNMWATFTVWCWTFQAVYFFWAGLSCFFEQWLKETKLFPFSLWVLYQCMFAMALLVTSCVWCVLVPGLEIGHRFLEIAAAGQGLGIMYSTFGYVTHCLNLVFMLVELGLNRLSFKKSHVNFCILYGFCYVLFAWTFHHHTNVWFYFFLDYEPTFAVIPYMILSGVTWAYFKVGEWCSDHLKKKQHPRDRDMRRPPKSLTKPNKIRRHETVSSVVFWARAVSPLISWSSADFDADING